jgi:GT2 family glycosyltransferase
MTPLVSVVVPTRDHPELVAMAHATIRRAGWPRVEVVFVDNGTTDPRARAELDRSPHRVVSAPIPFNFARLANRGAAVARGEVIVLLNNDVEARADGWLEHLMRPLRADPSIGVVGAMLSYPSGRVQHAGITMADGVPRHEWLGEDPAALPEGVATTVRDCDAVTGACIAVRADLWRSLGGMAAPLATNYNDVDLCLRARAAGHRVVCAPVPGLIHHESESRGGWSSPAVAADWLLFRSRWGAPRPGDRAHAPSPARG